MNTESPFSAQPDNTGPQVRKQVAKLAETQTTGAEYNSLDALFEVIADDHDVETHDDGVTTIDFDNCIGMAV